MPQDSLGVGYILLSRAKSCLHVYFLSNRVDQKKDGFLLKIHYKKSIWEIRKVQKRDLCSLLSNFMIKIFSFCPYFDFEIFSPNRFLGQKNM